MSTTRFKEAQERFGEYETALEEVRQGRKRSHWIWYIFPQLKGLGISYNSEYYGIASLEEAKEYLGDAVLRGRAHHRDAQGARKIKSGNRHLDFRKKNVKFETRKHVKDRCRTLIP